MKKTVEETMEFINELEEMLKYADDEMKAKILSKIAEIDTKAVDALENDELSLKEKMAIKKIISKAESILENDESKESTVTVGYVNDKRLKEGKSNLLLKRISIGAAGAILVTGIILGAVSCAKNNTENEPVKVETENLEDVTIKEVEEEKEEKVVIVDKQEEKEEAIMDYIYDVKAELNSFEDLNVTTEQALALYIHLNLGNSYTTNDYLTLDKVTRDNLIKKYFIGLSKDTEVFDTYEIQDEDLSKVSALVFEIRNTLNNRIIVLNEEGNYEESKAIIKVLNNFVLQSDLKDEMNALTENVANMQTDDLETIKENAYRYYNYAYASIGEEGVRNFNQYGYLEATNENGTYEMTYENQGMTIRFATWFLNVFVSNSISGKEIIPDDIIDDLEAKLADQSTLMQALGYSKCDGDTYAFTKYFQESITGKQTKNGKKKSKGSNGSSIAHATGDQQKDSEIDKLLRNNNAVGTSWTLSSGETFTVIESGPSSTTIEIGGGGNYTEEVITSGPSEVTIEEGGGNEVIEEIIFTPDESEVVIEEGGEYLSAPESTPEPVSVPESEPEPNTVASIKDQINFLKSLKNSLYTNTDIIEIEDNFQKVKC